MHRTLRGVILLLLLLAAPILPASEVGEIYKRVKSAVVVIETEQKEVDPVFPGQVVTVGGLGSGVLISKDGQVMTASHVVQTADRVSVRFMSGEQIPARVLGSEPYADLALLQLERRPAIAQVASLGDSDKVEVGDQIFVVGAPHGISHTLTVGHISARRREAIAYGSMFETEMFQTDAAINQGNSGGPMFNRDGKVIGIVSYIISHSGGFEGLGFVITSNVARRLLLDQRSLWSGMQGQVLDGQLARIFNVPQERGLLVQAVSDHSPSSHVGLRGGTLRANIAGLEMIVGGDIILEVMGVSLADPDHSEEARKLINRLKAGDEIRVKVLRGGEIIELKNFFFPDLLVPGKPADDD